MSDQDTYPACFGRLETVFPMGADGLRHTPDKCMDCVHKTACLKTAMSDISGMKLREEMVDRSYQAGMIGFWHRWSKKKSLDRKKKTSS